MGLLLADVTIPQEFFFFPQTFTKYLLFAHYPSTVRPWAFPFSLGEKAKSCFASGQCWVKCKVKGNLSLDNLRCYSYSKYRPSKLCLCLPSPTTPHTARILVTENNKTQTLHSLRAWAQVSALPLNSVRNLAKLTFCSVKWG